MNRMNRIIFRAIAFVTLFRITNCDSSTIQTPVVYDNGPSNNGTDRTRPPTGVNDYRSTYIYGLPVVIFLGTVGNTITLVVLCQRTMRQTGTYFYMAVLAVADSAVLYFNALRKWIYFLSGFDLALVSDAGCKTMSFLNYWTFDFATWILVAMTVDRFLAVHSPLRAVQLSTVSRIKKVLVLLAILDIGVNMHFFWTMSLLRNPKTDQYVCRPSFKYTDFHHRVWPIVDATVYSFLPFSMLLVFNLIIVQDMFVAWRVRKKLYANSNHHHDADKQSPNNSNRRNRGRNHLTTSSWHLTLMLLVVTTVFLALSAPTCIFLILRFTSFGGGPPTPDERQRQMIAKAVTTLLVYINHCVNFYLYCASGRKFRQTLVSIYKYARERRRLSATASVTQNTRVSFSSLTGRISMVSEHSQT